MAQPLYISQIHRLNGVTTLQVIGHGLTPADQGRPITIVGASDSTVNGVFKITRVLVPDVLQFNQPNVHPIAAAISGGACAFG